VFRAQGLPMLHNVLYDVAKAVCIFYRVINETCSFVNLLWNKHILSDCAIFLVNRKPKHQNVPLKDIMFTYWWKKSLLVVFVCTKKCHYVFVVLFYCAPYVTKQDTKLFW